MYFNQPIDRYHSSSFDYSSHTDSKALSDAIKSIWLSLPSDIRAAIDPVGPNAKKAGLPTLEVVVLQLFRLWITEPERCLATPRGNNLKVKSIYNPKGISPEKLRNVFNALEAEPPPLKWSAPIVRKAEDQRWRLRDLSLKRLS